MKGITTPHLSRATFRNESCVLWCNNYLGVQLSCRASECAEGSEIVWFSRHCERLNLIIDAILLVFPGQRVPAEEHIHYESV